MAPERTVEQRLRAAVESAPTGILMIDAQGRIVLVNSEVERLFGYSREEILGKPVELLVPDRFRERHPEYRAAFLAAPSVRAMGAGRELFARRKDGSELPVEIGLTPVATDDGLFVLSTIVDISARKHAEELFRVAVESSPSGMLMIDRQGRIVLVNREIERMFAYQRGELLGKSIEMLVPERFRAEHPQLRRAFFEQPETRAMGTGRDLYGVRKDGVEIPVEIGLNPIITESDVFVLGSVVDIGARKAAEAERRKLEQQLRQAQKMEAVGTLAGGIAHDFNNILGTILGYTELIKSELPEDASLHSELAEVLKATERGRQLVQRILLLSRRQEAVRRSLSLGATVQEALKLLRATLPATIDIRANIAPDTPRVLADPTSVHQVLVNFATNAAHAMPDGGTIEIETSAVYLRDSFVRAHPELSEGQHALLSVRDSGCGMEPWVLERAFEPFFTTKPAGAGSGLGLAMVHAIVRDHAGMVEIESSPGQGTTARCYLPAVEAGAADVASLPARTPRGDGERVLYVEDEPSLLRIAERSLRHLGYNVIGFGDSADALDFFCDHVNEIDVVVTDYFMPKLTGIELARKIHERDPAKPILMLTGYLGDLPSGAIEAAGVRKLTAKPVALQQLAEALHGLLYPNART